MSVPVPVNYIEQVVSAKLLGVVFEVNFKMDALIDFLISQCSQRLYLLKLLRSQALNVAQLD